MTGFRDAALLSIIAYVDVSAIRAAAAATSATYRSFADATRSVLDLLERHMGGSALFLAHLDRGQFIHRIVDVRGGGDYGLRSNQALPLGDAFCSHMAEGRGPRRCGEVGSHDVYAGLGMQQRVAARSYLGVPAGAVGRDEGRFLGRPVAAPQRLHGCRRAAVRDARARARVRARTRV
jgi:hypothetical protein